MPSHTRTPSRGGANQRQTRWRALWVVVCLLVGLLATQGAVRGQPSPSPPSAAEAGAPRGTDGDADAGTDQPTASPARLERHGPRRSDAAAKATKRRAAQDTEGQESPNRTGAGRVEEPGRMSRAAGKPRGGSGSHRGAGGEAGGINLKSGALPLFEHLFLASPIINGIIAGLSIIALMLFLYFLLTVNSRAMVPPDLVDEATKLVIRGKYEAASDLCRANRRVFIATIVQRCVENAAKGHSVILDVIDSEGRRRADVVWNRISYLADVSNVAPMFGLLGTVVGMIYAFFGLQRESGTINAYVLSRGVAQAMSTTMFGLIVGIMALVFYSIVKSRVTRVLADAEQAVHSIADHVRPTVEAAASREEEPTPRRATPAQGV